MTGKKKQNDDTLDESLRRLGGILASPSLVMSYEHTTPRAERAKLRRLGLSREEAEAFLEQLCARGLLDGGAMALVAEVCRARGIGPVSAARLLLAGEGWPEEGEE